MIALIFSFLYFVYIFSCYFESNKDKNENYVIFAASLIFSVASNGLISMLFIATKIIYFPVFLVQGIIFLTVTDSRKFKKIFSKFIGYFLDDFSKLKNNYSNKFLILIALLLISLFLASFGPINQSDTVNYYVGYPFQYYLRNSHFVDGDLGQGLLGIGDFANITFIQEKSIWLIRVSQYLPLIPILMFLGKRKIPNFIILIFLSSPVFLQWLTIGKINFLGDSCLSLIYLCWKSNNSQKYALITFFAGLLSISIKISSILVFIPIIFDILITYKFRPHRIFIEQKLNFSIIKILIFFISISSILSIFYYRFFLTGNLFFPILSSIFSSGNEQFQDWEIMLRNFDREGFYQFWIFFPKNPSKIASVLGPATGFFFLIKFWEDITKFIFKRKFYLNIGFLQLIFLFLFAQGRADYYFSPLFLLVYGSKNLFDNKIKSEKYLKVYSKNILKTFFAIQFFLFTISAFYMISLNMITLFNYEKAMNKTAYGYYNSKLIKENAIEPVLGLATSPSRLFYNSEYIPNHNYWKCIKYSNYPDSQDRENFCLEKLKVKTVIVDEDYLKNNKNYDCNTVIFKETPRNILKSSKYKVDFCKKNN